MKMSDWNEMVTEQINTKTVNLDLMTIKESLLAMNDEYAKVAGAVRETIPQVEQAVHAVIQAFNAGGRLVYAGAGTSGRLALLDAAECSPTFGTPPGQVVALLAGGEKAFIQAVEGAEDDAEAGVDDLKTITPLFYSTNLIIQPLFFNSSYCKYFSSWISICKEFYLCTRPLPTSSIRWVLARVFCVY